jgi:methyl-accepting chemotaxis protein
MVEESNAAAHELARAAEELRRIVSSFRTSERDARTECSPRALRVA